MLPPGRSASCWRWSIIRRNRGTYARPPLTSEGRPGTALASCLKYLLTTQLGTWCSPCDEACALWPPHLPSCPVGIATASQRNRHPPRWIGPVYVARRTGRSCPVGGVLLATSAARIRRIRAGHPQGGALGPRAGRTIGTWEGRSGRRLQPDAGCSNKLMAAVAQPTGIT